MTEAKTKKCNRCDSDKPLALFNKNSAKADGLQTYCRECQRDIDKNLYLNSDGRSSSIRESAKKRQEYIRSFRDSLLGCGCVVCGEKERCTLDFHHTSKTSKEFQISSMVRLGFSVERIKREAKKCVVVCANCHRKIHSGVVSL